MADDESETRLCSIFNGLKNVVLTADIFESYGTIRFITIFPLVIKALLTGAVLIVDEFDASIHPMALNSIINVFRKDDINVKHARLNYFVGRYGAIKDIDFTPILFFSAEICQGRLISLTFSGTM